MPTHSENALALAKNVVQVRDGDADGGVDWARELHETVAARSSLICY
jgi:hypothetical protein